MNLNQLILKAQHILDENWTGRSTKPSPHLYPHQWNWDSGFIAIGYARYDQDKAMQELTTLFKAQWENGMLPQIVFHPEALGGYFPEPDFWQVETSPNSPKDFLTSGITMPPVHAIAALHIFEYATDRDQVISWLEYIYPKLLRLHEYFYRERDPYQEGLVYIRHPWESGLDNSPSWDLPLQTIHIQPDELPVYQRKDLTKGIPASQRPTDDDYDRYVYLVDLFRKSKYDEKIIFKTCPFLIQDPLFNSILSRSNEALVTIGTILNKDVGQLKEWHAQTNQALREKLWDESHGSFDAYDLYSQRRIEMETASGFMPLLCGAPTQEMAHTLYQFLESNSFCTMHNNTCFSIPNYNLQGEYLNTANYWRGPVWINTNWLLMKGLYRYGFHEKAMSVQEDIIELVRRWGFHEFFDPYKGIGYGTDQFSWTAALFIDVAMDKIQQQKQSITKNHKY